MQAVNIEIEADLSQFDVLFLGENVGRFSLPLPGEHFISNCLGAIAVAIELGLDFHVIKEALKGFQGLVED